MQLLLRTNVFVAGGVTALGAWASGQLAIAPSAPLLLVLLSGTLLIYNLDHLRDDRRKEVLSPGARPRLDARMRGWVLAGAGAGLAAGFALGGSRLLLASLPAGLVGLLYGASVFGGRLKDLPGAKSWLVATAVAHAVALMPPLATGAPLGRATLVVAAFAVTLCALNAHCFDLRDVDVDAAGGSTTWAVHLGAPAAHRRLVALAALAAVAFAGLTIVERAPVEAPATLALAAVSLLLVRPGAPRERYGLVVDGWLYAPLLLGALAG